MKIMDKIKNFFYDEEEIEVPKVEKKTEEKLNNIKEVPISKAEEKETKRFTSTEEVEDIISERELFKSETTFKFPIIFEDEDFSPEKKKNKSMNVLDVENTIVRETVTKVEERTVFKPTPIISPIYGVLGQNYGEDNTVPKEDIFLNLYEKEENVDIDTVISRAYGYQKMTYKEEITIDEPQVEVEEKKEEVSIDLFNDMVDQELVVKVKEEDININENDEDDFKGDYKLTEEARLKSIDDLLESTDEQDFYKLVDSMYEDNEE
jgi:hypothetical protein